MILSVVWAVVAVVILVDLAVQGRSRSALATALLVVAISGIMYACAWRPRVVADADAVTVINPLRDYRVPWTAVEQVELAYSLRLRCAPAPGGARGKVISSWAVQSGSRPRSRRDLMQNYAQRRSAKAGPGYRPTPPSTPRYASHPAVEEAMNRTPAQYAQARLEERVRKARLADAGASVPGPGAAPDGAGAPTAAPAAPGPASAAPGPTARWAWLSIALMAVPAVAFIMAVLV